jgi:PPK2 family polyphosphate:nucleotide phosphotransferase
MPHIKTNIVTACPGQKIRLSNIDADETAGMSKEEALLQIGQLRERVSELQQTLYAEHRQSLLIVFQAMDTGGKDGTIRNLLSGINPAGIYVTAFKVPSPQERDHDFLWRVHKATPPKGMIGVWNRSHYEDVLVVRVHKLVEKNVWKSRFDQINSFEGILASNDITIVKFMLHISKDEQEGRLRARLKNPHKWWKFSPSDLKERELWDDYQEAYEEAINRCTTDCAPWHVVPANRKWARDLAVIELLFRILKKMDPQYPKLTFDPKTITINSERPADENKA